jgi:L,D-peptidoglycan transpeptidase YkuD (ErfK/YbiS/YcfS/YnhG family)
LIRLEPEQPGDRLKRADHLYDLFVELDHNTRPRIAGRGSAVFVHVARPGFAPTAGCVALTAAALRRLIARASPRTRIVVG